MAERSDHLDFGIIIPARFCSSRLPGKPLLELEGKPLIVRVLENAQRARARFVWVATDDERIREVVHSVGGEAVMTRSDHASGSDRLAELIERRCLPDRTIVVNVQGDEPSLDPEHVWSVARALVQHPAAGIATLATPISEARELFEPNVVKVVTNAHGMALSFSRAPIPWVRGHFASGRVPDVLPPGVEFLRHVGLYAYTASTLRLLAKSAPVALEQAESLEQLRALWLGIGIHVTVTHDPPAPGIDTEADLERARQAFAAKVEPR